MCEPLRRGGAGISVSEWPLVSGRAVGFEPDSDVTLIDDVPTNEGYPLQDLSEHETNRGHTIGRRKSRALATQFMRVSRRDLGIELSKKSLPVLDLFSTTKTPTSRPSVDAGAVGHEQAGAAVDEAQAHSAAAFPFARGDPAAAQVTPGGTHPPGGPNRQP